jgi:hypothetical protein
MYGWALIAEEPDGRLYPVGSDVANADNWRETTEYWFLNRSTKGRNEESKTEGSDYEEHSEMQPVRLCV